MILNKHHSERLDCFTTNFREQSFKENSFFNIFQSYCYNTDVLAIFPNIKNINSIITKGRSKGRCDEPGDYKNCLMDKIT